MARVFISFVHEDKSVAEAIQFLISQELKLDQEVFLSADQSLVLAGDIWLDKIRAGLESCEVLVLVLSYRSLRRAWVNFEAGAIWLSKRPVIPVCIGNVYKDSLPQPYAGMQAVALPHEAYYLVKSLHAHLRLAGVPPTSPFLKKVFELAHQEGDTGRSILDMVYEPYDVLEIALKSWTDETPPVIATN